VLSASAYHSVSSSEVSMAAVNFAIGAAIASKASSSSAACKASIIAEIRALTDAEATDKPTGLETSLRTLSQPLALMLDLEATSTNNETQVRKASSPAALEVRDSSACCCISKSIAGVIASPLYCAVASRLMQLRKREVAPRW